MKPEKQLIKDYVLINPQVLTGSPETDTYWEGCLSIPEVWLKIKRPKKVKVKSVDEEPLVISRNTDLTLSVSEKHAQELEESGIRLLKEESSAG